LLLAGAREYLPALLRRAGCGDGVASLAPKLAPMLVVIGSIALAIALQLASRHGVAVVGGLPRGLPELGIPAMAGDRIAALLFPAFAIGLLNFVGSISVAQALAVRRNQRVDPDAELRALGAANIASGFSGGFPVNGGFARSLVNFAAGAQTPLAGVFAALAMALVVSTSTGIFAALPISVLAATIIVAVAPVIDIRAFHRAWRYDRADAVALAATALGVVAAGVEAGIGIGIGMSLASLVWRSSHPHIAVLGRVPFTEHFRNIDRYKTETLPDVLALRIDESLLFANADAVERRVRAEVERRPELKHVLLVMSSVSQIDSTAVEMLIELNGDLRTRGIELHFSELKGPVLERLQRSPLLQQLTGRVFMSTHLAFQTFSREQDYSI
jgi:SulP family sulfate permease